MARVARRPVALVAAIVLLAEALGVVVLNGVLATFVDRQNMSMAGLDPDAMATGTWIMGGVAGLFLLLCGAVLLRAGLRDRAPGRWARVLLIACAIVHGVLGAVTVALVGWTAFAFMMLVLGLLVFVLLAYGSEERRTRPPADRPAPAGPPPAGPATNGTAPA
ncbi:hypothetical protein ABT160_24075 [Streptomyces sp. NPDC001941]|uniref:hypothetical protein n=1 Tax=Streptomyces sp. NPDC001941 TaxID=3154659 RepID=UPI00332C8FB6